MEVFRKGVAEGRNLEGMGRGCYKGRCDWTGLDWA